jgi:trehalose utilization protein
LHVAESPTTAMVQVTVWNEYRSETKHERGRELYPEGIHAELAAILEEEGHDVRTATLEEPEHGLTDEVLESTDVMLWWGHEAHDEVDDAIVEKVKQRVLEGMGLLVLHSAHYSKIFQALMGTTGSLKWRDTSLTDGERERVWIIEPNHPIVDGLNAESIEIPQAEMYGERFDIPAPDTLVTISWFEGGEVFRSGCCYKRGEGRVFYFRPGHETYPVYKQDEIRTIIGNAVDWAAPGNGPAPEFADQREPLEEIKEGIPPEHR